MGLHTARVPENLEEYLRILIKKGYAATYGGAINSIILERMMRDRELGEITPFRYKLSDNRTAPTKEIGEIETGNIVPDPNVPLGEPPATRGPDPHRFAGIDPTSEEIGNKSYFGAMTKPPFPGSMEEYNEALRVGSIKKDQFNPPE